MTHGSSGHSASAGSATAARSTPASGRQPPPAPLIAPTGSPGVNCVVDVLNSTAAPFMNAPPADQGAAGVVAQGLGGVMGLIGAPQMIIDTAFASLTAPIAALFPAMPAVTLLGMHVAPPHTHMHPPSLIPPAPPVPLPSLGVLVGSGSITVLLGGLPAARAGDIGLAITCGSLAPPFEVFTGSSNVFLGGARAARVLDLTKHCNPTSMGPFAIAMGVAGVAAGAAGAVATGSGWAAAQAAADAAVLAVKLLVGKDPGLPPGMGALVGPPVPNVLIGGFPCPPIGEMAVGGLMRALKAFGRAAKNFRNSRRGNAHCANGTEPVYLITGENFNTYVDFVSDGLFRWERHYTSGRHRQDGPLGFGNRHCYQRSLDVRLHKATYTDWDGERFQFPRFERGSDTSRSNGYVLRKVRAGHYLLSYRNEPTMEFSGGGFDVTLPLRKLTTGEHELEFEYDDLGRLAAMTEWQQEPRKQTRYELRYDRDGRITELLEMPREAPGARRAPEPTLRAAYAYSRSGGLVEAQDALGGRWRYELDWFHRMVKQTDPRGYSYTFKYDASSRCVWASGEDGLWWAQIQYFPEKKLTRYTEGESAVWEYHYDNDGFLQKLVDPYGGKTVRERDAEGKVVREIDAGGRVVRMLYDADGANTGRVDHLGYVYPTELEMPNLPNALARDLPSTALARHYAGLVESTPRAALGAMGSLLETVPPELVGLAARAFRAPRGALAAGEIREERDALGRRVKEIDPLGRTREWRYDATGNVIELLDRDGQRVEQRTTSWNLLGERRTPVGQSLRYQYSKLEQVTAVIDPHGNVSRYDYDLKERLVRVHRHGRAREEYVFDGGDHLVEKRDGAGEPLFWNEVHPSHFVGVRRLASGGEHRYDYDARGRITEASTEAHEVRIRYDDAGRRSSDLRDGRGVEHRHLGGAERTRLFDRFSLTSDTNSDGGSVLVSPDGSMTTLRFDERGFVHRRCGNGTSELLQYDSDGRLEGRLTWKRTDDGAFRAWSVAYQYSLEGDMVAALDSARGATLFEVDAAHRLIGETPPVGRKLFYELDPADNVISKPGLGRVELTSGNRLAASDTELFAHDARDHLALRQDRRTGALTRYVYDSFDMLTRVEMTDVSGASEPPWEYTYDGLGRRIRAVCGAYRREFFWDGDRLAAEVSPNGALRVYQYAGRDALSPLGFTDYASVDAEPETGRTFYVFSDPQGMPLHAEDERGEVVWWALRVDPYGRIDVHPAASIEYNLRWPGHYFDPETGLHCNRYRYYDPHLGRYLQSDPIGYAGSEVNLYGYCVNPLVDVDVLGLAHSQKRSNSRRGQSGDNDGVEGTPTTRPPPHAGTPLNDMTPTQLHDTVKHHADTLAALQEPRPERRTMNTFSVGVVEDGNGSRRMVATSNMDVDSGPNRAARDHMERNGIANESDAAPRLQREPVRDANGQPVRDANGREVRQTVNADTGEVHDKRARQDHHAEQRLQNAPRAEGERVVAQSPSQPCCAGCHATLSQPDANGARPIDNIPPDRRGTGR